MILLLDSGNSRLKWAWQTAANAPLSNTGGDAFEPALAQIIQTSHKPKQILVGNVAGDARATAITTWAQATWNIEPQFIRTSKQAGGVTNAYTTPENLGVDRWLALLGARQQQGDIALLIADCGTAITLDHLAANGTHQGGLIVPGLQLMQDSLIARAPGIPTAAPNDERWAKDTPQAVGNGALQTVVHLLDGMARSHDGELIITGGDTATLLPYLHTPWKFLPHLVLNGLSTFAKIDL